MLEAAQKRTQQARIEAIKEGKFLIDRNGSIVFEDSSLNRK